MREKRGLAYAVYTFVWGYSDAGLFGVYCGAGEKTVGEAMNVTLDASPLPWTTFRMRRSAGRRRS